MDWKSYLIGNSDTGQQGLIKNPVDQFKQTMQQSPVNQMMQGLKGAGGGKNPCPTCGQDGYDPIGGE